MLKYVIPIWDLIEENSTHDFILYYFFRSVLNLVRK